MRHEHCRLGHAVSGLEAVEHQFLPLVPIAHHFDAAAFYQQPVVCCVSLAEQRFAIAVLSLLGALRQ